MRNPLLFLLLSFILFSCIESEDQFPQTWQMSGYQTWGFGGDSGLIATPDTAYTYLFRSDGTFLKTVGNETSSGTYDREKRIYDTHGKKTVYLLNFSEDRLVHSCSGSTEQLALDESGILSGGSSPCDGPTNYYSLVK